MSQSYDQFIHDHPGRDLDRNGLRLHYLDEGAGDPVVLLHGNPSWSFYYRHLVEALLPSYRAIVPDHIGCGRSDKPDDSRYDYRLASRVDDLEALLDHLGLHGGLTLVLHDWGGMIGMAYATRHPERIARLVVFNTAAFLLPTAKRFPWSLWLFRNSPLGAWLARDLNLFCQGTAAIGCKHHPMPTDVRTAYLAPYDSRAHRIAIHRFVQDIPLRPGDPSYALISEVENRLNSLAHIPMFIGWGMKDFVFDQHFLREWERRFPRAAVLRFPLAGHYVLEDEPETLGPLVLSFLAAHPLAREAV